MTIALYILVGAVVGMLSGALGIGGGVLLVPALIWIFGFEHAKATGTTLAVLVPPIGLLAAWSYYTKGLMDLEAAIWLALSFALGAYAGALIVPSLPVSVLRLAFGLMLVYIGLRFLIAADSEAARAAATLVGLVIAWAGYLGLRLLGRRLPRPRLEDLTHRVQSQRRDDTEYHI